MKNLWLTTLLTLLTTVVSATENNIEKMSKELALSEEQVTRIKNLREKNEEQRKQNLKLVKAAQAAFLSTTGNPKATSAEILESYNTLQIAKATHNRTGFEEVLEIRELMNEDQRMKFHELTIKNLKSGPP